MLPSLTYNFSSFLLLICLTQKLLPLSSIPYSLKSGQNLALGALRALTGINDPEQPHPGLPPHGARSLVSGQLRAFRTCLSWIDCRCTCLQLCHNHACAWPWTSLIQTLIRGLLSSLTSAQSRLCGPAC